MRVRVCAKRDTLVQEEDPVRYVRRILTRKGSVTAHVNHVELNLRHSLPEVRHKMTVVVRLDTMAQWKLVFANLAHTIRTNRCPVILLVWRAQRKPLLLGRPSLLLLVNVMLDSQGLMVVNARLAVLTRTKRSLEIFHALIVQKIR